MGRFQCTTATSGATLLSEIAQRLRAEGFDALIGPMDGDTWHNYRLVTESDGSSPFLMEPTSAPAQLNAFTSAGFNAISTYFSARTSSETSQGPAPAHVEDITIEPWNGMDPEGHFNRVFDLSCQAFAANPFYTPIDRDTFLALYMPYVPMLKPELVLMAYDRAGELVGFLFGIPDYHTGRDPDTAILKTYASLKRGVGYRLNHAFHVTAQQLGFPTVIHALVHDNNASAKRSRQHGGSVFRRYALMGLRLDG
ncbi:hypothetical protein [Arhodomonas sp. AD133]|uniref:hypothetical protein n=1 Tax=Arhodomonas sp. AD133 TaxID=3415009 RepID=UPI003EBEEAEB